MVFNFPLILRLTSVKLLRRKTLQSLSPLFANSQLLCLQPKRCFVRQNRTKSENLITGTFSLCFRSLISWLFLCVWDHSYDVIWYESYHYFSKVKRQTNPKTKFVWSARSVQPFLRRVKFPTLCIAKLPPRLVFKQQSFCEGILVVCLRSWHLSSFQGDCFQAAISPFQGQMLTVHRPR